HGRPELPPGQGAVLGQGPPPRRRGGRFLGAALGAPQQGSRPAEPDYRLDGRRPWQHAEPAGLPGPAGTVDRWPRSGAPRPGADGWSRGAVILSNTETRRHGGAILCVSFLMPAVARFFLDLPGAAA